jgi:hypothetical protein
VARAKKQVRRTDVPDADHVARYCGNQSVERDPKTKLILGVYPQAFSLRVQRNEQYLSIYWMEYFSDTIDTQFQGAVAALRNKPFTLSNAGAFARLNAKRVRAAGTTRGHMLRIRDRSSSKDPGYASIENMPLDNSDIELLELLAHDCCIEVRGVAEIDSLP